MKIVIVGGVAGGASAAARARQLSEDVSIVVFERGKRCLFRQLWITLSYRRKNSFKAVTDSENPGGFLNPALT